MMHYQQTEGKNFSFLPAFSILPSLPTWVLIDFCLQFYVISAEHEGESKDYDDDLHPNFSSLEKKDFQGQISK